MHNVTSINKKINKKYFNILHNRNFSNLFICINEKITIYFRIKTIYIVLYN